MTDKFSQKVLTDLIVPWKPNIENQKYLKVKFLRNLTLEISNEISKEEGKEFYKDDTTSEIKNKQRTGMIRAESGRWKANFYTTLGMKKLVKLIRAQGGCLGTKSRRKTW